MLKYLLLVAIIGVANADDDAHAHVAKSYKKEDGHGHFSYGYDLTNGIGADEAGDEHAVHGEYHFVSKEGVPIKVSYTADEHGYHPHGDLLPTPPPTPPAILKALQYNKEHPHKVMQYHHNPVPHHQAYNVHQTTPHHVVHQDVHRNLAHSHPAQHNVHNVHHDGQVVHSVHHTTPRPHHHIVQNTGHHSPISVHQDVHRNLAHSHPAQHNVHNVDNVHHHSR